MNDAACNITLNTYVTRHDIIQYRRVGRSTCSDFREPNIMSSSRFWMCFFFYISTFNLIFSMIFAKRNYIFNEGLFSTFWFETFFFGHSVFLMNRIFTSDYDNIRVRQCQQEVLQLLSQVSFILRGDFWSPLLGKPGKLSQRKWDIIWNTKYKDIYFCIKRGKLNISRTRSFVMYSSDNKYEWQNQYFI